MSIVNPSRTQHLFFRAFVFIALVNTLSILSGCGRSHSSPPTVSSKPIGISAVAGDGSVTISWSAITSANFYNIYRSVVSGQTGSVISSGVSSTLYLDSGLTNGATYYYSISAVNRLGEGAVSSQVSARPAVASGSVTITGAILYQDKEYGLNGFTGKQPFKAVRYATVELVSPSGVISALTDSNGFYSITTGPTLTVYVRVLAEATPAGSGAPQAAVEDLAGMPYAVRGNDFLLSGSANVNISIPTTSIGGAFNILDVFTSGCEFINNFAGTYPTVTLFAFWQHGNPNGTYYCPEGYNSSQCNRGEGIYVLNSSTDTDEYDDDVLYHEFGHFTAGHFSKDDSQGGMHRLTDNDLDMRLTWSEGWGDFSPGAVKMWLSNTSQQNLLSSDPTVPLTEYIDSVGSGAGIAIDMNDPDGTYGRFFFYACGEVSIAKILLDLNIDFGMQSVWDVISSYTTSNPTTPVNLELFWDRWHSLGEPTTSPSLITIDSIFASRLINYAPDKYDLQATSDDTIQTAATYTFGVLQIRTLYGEGDVDYVAFSAQQNRHYTITTSNLKNGADTFITLIDPDQTMITANTTPSNPNDNTNGRTYTSGTVPSTYYYGSVCDSYGICHENGFNILGSRLTFTASSTGIYYVEIKSSPGRPVSAGKYGTYTLSITSP